MSSLRNKLLFFFLSTITVSLITVMLIISNISTKAIDNLASSEAALIVSSTSKSIGMEFSSSIKTLNNSISTAVNSRKSGIKDRDFLPPLFRDMLEQHENIFSLWILFEPDGWDEMDREYANTGDYDETGNYAVWAYRDRESGKIVVSTEAWGIEAYGEDYYSIPAVEKKISLIEPYTEEITEDYSVFMTTISKPVLDSRGEIIGVAGIDVSLDFLNEEIKKHAETSEGFNLISTEKGMILADSSESGTDNITEMFGEIILEKITEHSDEKKTVFFKNKDTKTGERLFQIAGSIYLDENLPAWTLLKTVKHSEIMKIHNKILFYMVITGLSALLVIAVFIFWFSLKITKPLSEVTEAARMISAGDLGKEIRIQTKDETGVLAAGFNKLTDKLSSHLLSTRNIMKTQKTNALKLIEEMKGTSDNLTDISNSVTSLIMKSSASTKSINETAESISDITLHIESLKNQINRQVEQVIHASSAIEQMLANIASVTENIKRSSGYYEKLMVASEEGKKDLDLVIKLASEISNKSENLQRTNTVITDIAEKTNLLSMNAAIEAAHAGDSGRGFAVVASEIRKLADDAEKQSKEIQTNLKSVTDMILGIKNSSINTGSKFSEIKSLIETVSAAEKEINFAMQEQSAGSNQVIASLLEMKEITEEIKNRSEEITKRSGIIMESSEGLKYNNTELKKVITNVYDNCDKIKNAVSDTEDLSQKNMEIADKLENSISLFRLKDII